MKLLSTLFLFLSFSLCGQAKIDLSNKATISILTCGPGQNELYSLFGHSAFRVKDEKNNLDKVYNYGTFDFNTPNFYLKFCRGQLLYQVSGYAFKYFPYQYHNENRWIKAQVLNLTNEENQKVYDFLEWNVLEENKNYKYDFFYDNCATKMHEVLEKSIGKIDFDYSNFPKGLTHRNLIHSYLPKNSWSKFGIDLALGAVIDEQAKLKEYMFLPDYLAAGVKKGSTHQKNLITKEKYILPYRQLEKPKTNFALSPMFVSIILVIASLYFGFISKKNNPWFDIISILFGVVGLIIVALWFLTFHTTTKTNMNLLWANPILLSYPFVSNRWKKHICYFGLGCLGVFVIIAVIGVQEFDTSFYLLAICLIPLYLKKLLPFKV
ncbi:MAG: DUF4105 domain-containing protein [Wenyingzhuangia sp.]